MRSSVGRLIPCSLVVASALAVVPLASAAELGNIVDKNYPVSGRTRLQVTTDNADIQTRACGECSAVRVHIDLYGQDPSRFHLSESQSGNAITISLKEREERGGGWGRRNKSPVITVELPVGSDARLRSSNGGIDLTGLQGDLDAETSNGGITVEHTQGPLRLESSNGEITVHDIRGPLHVSTSNGRVRGDGQMSKVEARSSNGGVDLGLASGSQLSADSTLRTSNGSVVLRVPGNLRATVRLHSDQGSVHSDFPLQSKGDEPDKHEMKGALNGGGPSLEMTASNGSVRLVAN